MIFFQPDRDSQNAPTLTDQISAAIIRAIELQHLRAGMAIPSIRQFARQYGVSTFTVASAYNRLAAQGVLSARPGSGYRVASSVRPPTSAVPVGWSPPAVGASWLLADVFADHSIPIKSGCGWLPSEWLNENSLRQALRQVARMPVRSIGGYGHPYGYYPLREHIAGWLSEYGLEAAAEQIVLTQGATQGLDIVIRTLLRPGDTVLVELPAYANLLHALRMAHINIIGVERTEDGLCINSLKDKVQSNNNIKALFVNPVLHNPTGTSMTMSNAFQVLQIAEHADFWVIEDDVSRDLLPSAGALLAAMAGLRRVIYVSGFSKSITPAIRVGYVVATPELTEEFAKTKMTLGLTTPETMERAVYQVLRLGQHRKHIQTVQDRLRQAHDILLDKLDQSGFKVFSRPGAGLFLWAKPAVPMGGATKVAQNALKHGIWLAPGSYFFPSDTLEQDTDWIRFNVAYSADPALWRFLRRAVQAK